MALVTTGFEASFALYDTGGNHSILTYELRGATYADAKINADAIAIALAAVTDAVIGGFRLAEVYEEAVFAYPAGGIEIENKASLTTLLAGVGAGKANLKVPAPVDGMFQEATGPGYNIVDIVDADLVTYTNLFKAAGECYISDGQDMDSLIAGKRVHAKSNRG